MEAFIIEKTEETPEIILNPAEHIFKISHRSLPENANGFYAPVFEWLEEFRQNLPDDDIQFVFELEYFNTATAKQIAKILLLLEKISHEVSLEIIWKYRKEDVDMMSSGLRYSKLLDVEFSIQEIEE
ncbi:MAG: DUF1987 domain-containing protein [Bacteroidales bacterium]|nr:DUF1987 domain-containing protein [Bacteroidales bacterium]HPY81891.1 DUF1987 domain-containing protein [Bacteroidales bacterium]